MMTNDYLDAVLLGEGTGEKSGGAGAVRQVAIPGPTLVDWWFGFVEGFPRTIMRLFGDFLV